MWVRIPLVAVTVTVEAPVGVPGSREPPPPPLLAPPQPAMVIRNTNAIRESSVVRARRLDPQPSRNTPATVNPKLAVHPPGPCNLALWAAVVVMVSVVEPLPVTDAGLKLHVLSRGKPEHDAGEKLTVPLNPGWPVTVSVAVPLPPGLGIVIDKVDAAKAKSACTFTIVAEDADPL